MGSAVKKPISSDVYERALAVATSVLFVTAAIAVAKGYDQWAQVSSIIWLHIATITLALILTPILLMRRRGDNLHRVIGWVWAGAMLTTAVLTSFFVRVINPGHLSLIHILSLITIIAVPRFVFQARRHQIVQHRRGVRSVITVAMLAAGVMTFPFGRLLGVWLMR